MSDAQKIIKQPLQWPHGGRTYLLADCDIEMELYFQAIHEGWARNRIEARKRFMTTDMYLTDISEFQESVSENRYAFGGKISFRWLLSPPGFLEYVLLKIQAGQVRFNGDPPDRDILARLQRDADPEWLKLEKLVLRHDFPNLKLADDDESAGQSGQEKTKESGLGSSTTACP